MSRDEADHGEDRRPDRADHVRALERGLAVLRAFAGERSLTLSEVARRTGLTRATARRFLITLDRLGYLRRDGRDFALTPKVLELGHSYLSSLDLAALARADMEALVARTHESSSAAVLDGSEIVYVARVPTRQIMTVSLGVGSRLPAFATAMGRVLLADLPADRLGCVLAASDLRQWTPRTRTDPAELAAEIATVAARGWALVDQELELGLRSVAAPLRDAAGRVVAALNVSTHVGRVTLGEVRDTLLPLLCDTATTISTRLSHRG
ncbi:MAG TPA: IclR family transcriptional regulator C-terminal domain-containing protein [Mycobacteriales bacterium]|nr:IclR family transcriptional regulator C-terminal domain-containing protein [Mycobacteriales bacterium]